MKQYSSVLVIKKTLMKNCMNKKYQIIYADPPWKYQDKSKSHGGGAESHYPCMSMIILDISAAFVYLCGGDIKKFIYWIVAATLTATVTF